MVGARTAGAVDRLSVAVVEDVAGLGALKAEWTALFDRCATSGNVFQSHEWCLTWAEVFLKRQRQDVFARQLFIVTARRGGRLVLVWPLVREQALGFRRLVWLGGPVSQYGDFLLDRSACGSELDADNVLERAWRFILDRGRADLIVAGKVRRDAQAYDFFRRKGAVAAVVAQAPYCDLGQAKDFDCFSAKFSKKARKNLKRKARRFAEAGVSSFERHEGGGAAARLAVEAMALKRGWLTSTGRVSRAILDQRTDRFFEKICAPERAVGAGTSVSVLWLDGKMAAAEVAFSCRTAMAVHVIVYDQRLQHLSPGQMLLQRSMAEGIARGVSRFDFMAPADGYKLAWADGTVEVVDWAMPLSARGSAYVHGYLKRVRPLLKSMQTSVPLPLRRLTSTLFASIAGRA